MTSIETDKSFAEAPAAELRDYINRGAQPLTIDDIPRWVEARFEGRLWLVSDKGDDLLNTQPGTHIELIAMEKRAPQRYLIHESYVNLWLRRREKIYFHLEDADNKSAPHERSADERLRQRA